MELRKNEIWRENGLNPDKYSQAVGEAMQQYANEFHQTEINKLNKSDVMSSVCNCYRTDENKIVMCNNCLKELTGID